MRLRPRRLLSAAVLTAAATITLAPHAGAVQTDDLTLSAAPLPDGQARPALSGAGDRPSTDTLVVGDRGSAPITVDLNVISARRMGASFSIGGPLEGLGKLVVLPVRQLHLEPGQSVRVPVQIGAAPGPTTYAAVTAQVEGGVTAGSIAVAERLAVLAESQGGDQVAAPVAHPAAPPSGGMSGVWPAIAGGALALVAAALAYEHARSRGRRASAVARAEMVGMA